MIKEISSPKGDKGWAHKNKKHWVDKPHKAIPAQRPLDVVVPA